MTFVKAGSLPEELNGKSQAIREVTQNDDSKQNSTLEVKGSVEPSFREVNYTAGIGVEYTVRFDEETYYRLQAYQDKIGSATKSGAIARLLDAIAEARVRKD